MEDIKLTGDAEAKKKQPQAAKTPEAKAPEAKAPESVYPIRELVSGYKAFGVPKEIAAVALKLKGIEQATFAEAKKIIEEFKNREVK